MAKQPVSQLSHMAALLLQDVLSILMNIAGAPNEELQGRGMQQRPRDPIALQHCKLKSKPHMHSIMPFKLRILHHETVQMSGRLKGLNVNNQPL